MWLEIDELMELGFSAVGTDCKISRKCSFYSIRGELGDNVRIDDYCTLKGEIYLDDYVHIAGYCMISGMGGPVNFGPFAGLAARCTVLTASADYRSLGLMVPQAPERQRVPTITGPITFKTASIIGAHSVVLPNVTVGVGANTGCGCVIAKDIPDGGILRNAKPELSVHRRDFHKIEAMVNEALGRAV